MHDPYNLLLTFLCKYYPHEPLSNLVRLYEEDVLDDLFVRMSIEHSLKLLTTQALNYNSWRYQVIEGSKQQVDTATQIRMSLETSLALLGTSQDKGISIVHELLSIYPALPSPTPEQSTYVKRQLMQLDINQMSLADLVTFQEILARVLIHSSSLEEPLPDATTLLLRQQDVVEALAVGPEDNIKQTLIALLSTLYSLYRLEQLPEYNKDYSKIEYLRQYNQMASNLAAAIYKKIEQWLNNNLAYPDALDHQLNLEHRYLLTTKGLQLLDSGTANYMSNKLARLKTDLPEVLKHQRIIQLPKSAPLFTFSSLPHSLCIDSSLLELGITTFIELDDEQYSETTPLILVAAGIYYKKNSYDIEALVQAENDPKSYVNAIKKITPQLEILAKKWSAGEKIGFSDDGKSHYAPLMAALFIIYFIIREKIDVEAHLTASEHAFNTVFNITPTKPIEGYSLSETNKQSFPEILRQAEAHYRKQFSSEETVADTVSGIQNSRATMSFFSLNQSRP